jgi:DNA-binding winged helix-turn-helix (wHTH) protein
MKPEGIFQFGEFQVDALARTLRRETEIAALNRRAFDVLLYLVQNPGRVLTRDELLKDAWPDTFVDENSLAQSISALRRALEEKPGDNNYIVTLPGRGYQFVSPVQVVVPPNLGVVPDAAAANSPGPSGVIFRQQTIRTSVITEEKEQLSLPVSRNRALVILVVGFVAVLILAVPVVILAGWYWRSHRTSKLTEKDTVVLADFDNRTGDQVFDGTLKAGLSISLRQSPFLNLLSDSEVSETLRLMTRLPGTKITPEVARELCVRAGSKAYIAGLIGSLGRDYVLVLKAVNCQSGDMLTEEQVTAASKEKVLDALGEAASKLRGKLGESLATVQKFDVPLAQATTPSLEALKEYSLGIKAGGEKGSAAALPYFQRAIEIDPNFAMGYLLVGNYYNNLSEVGRASEYVTKAFQLREHASEREKLSIAASYYRITGELDKAALTSEQRVETYPREWIAYSSLGLVLAAQGQYEKSAEIARQGLRVASDQVYLYEVLAFDAMALQRFGEAQQIIHEALARRLDDSYLHNDLYALAFLEANSAAMAAQQQWFAGRPEYENFGLALASDTEAYRGHAAKARELTKRAVDSAIRADSKENGAIWQANAALQEAAYNNSAEARRAAAEALELSAASPGVEAEASLAFAMAGDAARAESLAQDLQKRFPLDTQMQALWLPAIYAQLALDRKKPASTLGTPQAASPIELGTSQFVNNLSCLYHVYVRGEAYLANGQGTAAAAEFQKILDHSGIVWNCWTGALARLGVARANAVQARTLHGADAVGASARSRAAYEEFLTLWKDADPDLPILKAAKAEYTKLQ